MQPGRRCRVEWGWYRDAEDRVTHVQPHPSQPRKPVRLCLVRDSEPIYTGAVTGTERSKIVQAPERYLAAPVVPLEDSERHHEQKGPVGRTETVELHPSGRQRNRGRSRRGRREKHALRADMPMQIDCDQGHGPVERAGVSMTGRFTERDIPQRSERCSPGGNLILL